MSLFGLRELPDPATMERLSAHWRPFRSVACWYLWRVAEEGPPMRKKKPEEAPVAAGKKAVSKKGAASKKAPSKVAVSKVAVSKKLGVRAAKVLSKR
jgi:hypothetical protein